ncbi:hypothetical protein AnaeK_2013 [Anaeromyxobacter sp. K]|nr:hypothetical protein AnaeK_2013 [Anaeromyxobacter sp. K]
MVTCAQVATLHPAAGGELEPGSRFRCLALSATLSVRVCVLRQAVVRRQRTLQTSRGQGTSFPTCDGCLQGAALRAALPGGAELRWRGSGPGGRFARGRQSGGREQQAARRRLARVGLLELAPTIDDPPPELDE